MIKGKQGRHDPFCSSIKMQIDKSLPELDGTSSIQISRSSGLE